MTSPNYNNNSDCNIKQGPIGIFAVNSKPNNCGSKIIDASDKKRNLLIIWQ